MIATMALAIVSMIIGMLIGAKATGHELRQRLAEAEVDREFERQRDRLEEVERLHTLARILKRKRQAEQEQQP